MVKTTTKVSTENKVSEWRCNNPKCKKKGFVEKPDRVNGKRYCVVCGLQRR